MVKYLCQTSSGLLQILNSICRSRQKRKKTEALHKIVTTKKKALMFTNCIFSATPPSQAGGRKRATGKSNNRPQIRSTHRFSHQTRAVDEITQPLCHRKRMRGSHGHVAKHTRKTPWRNKHSFIGRHCTVNVTLSCDGTSLVLDGVDRRVGQPVSTSIAQRPHTNTRAMK